MSTNEEKALGYAAAAEHKTNHVLHLLLTLVTAGAWSWVWLFIASGNISKRNKIKNKFGLPTETNTPKILLWINAIFWILIIFILIGPKTEADGLPECNSNEAKKTLENAFNNSQFARQLNLSVVEINEAKDVGNKENKELRECAAKIGMNNTNVVNVSYQLKLKNDGTYILEFKVVE